MNFTVSLLLLVVSISYANSADVVDKPKAAGASNKKEPNLLKADPANKDIAAASSTPSTPQTGAPTPVAPDEKGDWVLNYTSTATCIRFVAETTIKVGYTSGNNEAEEKEILIPKKATASGDCSTGTFNLTWSSNGMAPKKNEWIQFIFTVDSGTQIWRVVNITGSVIIPIPSKAQKTHQYVPFSFYNNNTCFFNSHVGMSYKCLKSNSYNIFFHDTNRKDLNFTSAILSFSQLQVEAFKPNKTNNSAFGSSNNCEITPDMVPIAVGCALAGLVVIVLVAYLISQRKPPAQGYRSV